MRISSKSIGYFTLLGGLAWVLSFVSDRVDNSPSVHWEKISEQFITDTPAYSSLHFFDEYNGIALSVTSLDVTADGGKTWKMTYDFKNKGLHKLLITNSDTGWVVGEEWTNKKKNKPAILRTVDRGRHWRNVAVDSNSLKQIIGSFSVFDDICVATNGHTWIVGDGGIIEARLTESSLTVLNIFKGTEKLYNLFCRKSGDIWATGENGVVAHYNQKRWQYQRLGDNYLFTKIVAKDDYLWLIGRSIIVDSSKGTSGKGILLRSTDNGITWKDKTPEDADGLVDIYFDSNVGWSVGLNGTIYSTSDGGESWIKEPSPTTRNLVSIFFLNAQSGWIAGDSKIVLTYLSTRQ